MAENKTKPTDAKVEDYLAGIVDANRRKDCAALVALMARVTNATPTMWGSAIVGFGVHKYKYASGRTGETCLIGFSSRKGDISIYGTDCLPERAALLASLGKHKSGVGCLYIRALKDVDMQVLEQLLSEAVKAKAGSTHGA